VTIVFGWGWRPRDRELVEEDKKGPDVRGDSATFHEVRKMLPLPAGGWATPLGPAVDVCATSASEIADAFGIGSNAVCLAHCAGMAEVFRWKLLDGGVKF